MEDLLREIRFRRLADSAVRRRQGSAGTARHRAAVAPSIPAARGLDVASARTRPRPYRAVEVIDDNPRAGSPRLVGVRPYPRAPTARPDAGRPTSSSGPIVRAGECVERLGPPESAEVVHHPYIAHPHDLRSPEMPLPLSMTAPCQTAANDACHSKPPCRSLAVGSLAVVEHHVGVPSASGPRRG
jgi:hypothetical protein